MLDTINITIVIVVGTIVIPFPFWYHITTTILAISIVDIPEVVFVDSHRINTHTIPARKI